jgi:formylglycine-generating enzyme required for sulfatase activity
LRGEADWRDDPVLSIVARRQYVDWRAFRHAPVNTPAFGQEIERFCSKVAETLREPWISPEERRQMEAEARRRAEEEGRLRLEVEAKRRAEDEERLRREAEAQRRLAEEERLRQESEAKKSAEEERRKQNERTPEGAEARSRTKNEIGRLADPGELSKPWRPSRRDMAIVGILVVAITAGVAVWWDQDRGKEPTRERALKAGDSFKECNDCPEMIVVPAGRFLMGSLAGQGHDDEHPQHEVTIAKPFAVAKFELTFDEWDACAAQGGCRRDVNDNGWGRGRRPAINVSWDDAQTYVNWLSRITGKDYRLLSEAEYEYAARAGTQTAYPGGDDIKLSKPRRSARSPRTLSLSTIWSATSGSGRRIVGTRATKARRPTARRGRAAIAVTASSAAIPGATFRSASARRSASGSPPASGSATLVSGSPGRLALKSSPLYFLGSRGLTSASH